MSEATCGCCALRGEPPGYRYAHPGYARFAYVGPGYVGPGYAPGVERSDTRGAAMQAKESEGFRKRSTYPTGRVGLSASPIYNLRQTLALFCSQSLIRLKRLVRRKSSIE